MFSSGDKWSGCAARVHVLTQGDLCFPSPAATAGSGDQRWSSCGAQESAEAVVPRAHEPGEHTGGPHNSGRAELGRQNTTIGGLVPGAMKPIGRALGSDHRGRERVAALSVRTARNRRTRTRMSGGVGGGGRNPPADPIRSFSGAASRSKRIMASMYPPHKYKTRTSRSAVARKRCATDPLKNTGIRTTQPSKARKQQIISSAWKRGGQDGSFNGKKTAAAIA